jgi:hypothetical protein
MPRKPAALRSRIQNLGPNAQKQPPATVEDIEDEGDQFCNNPGPASSSLPPEIPEEEMFEEDFIIDKVDGSLTLVGFLGDFEEEPLPDLAPDPDSDDEDEDEDEEDNHDIKELSDLEEFTRVLAEAQRIAIEAEDERLKGTGRPKQYLGNSARTKRRYQQINRDLEKKGYLSVKAWFEKAKALDPKSDGVDKGRGNQDANLEVITVDGEDQQDIQVSESTMPDSDDSSLVGFNLFNIKNLLY